MFQKFFFPIFVALMVVVNNPLSAQCVGVHVDQSWNCENGSSTATATPIGGTAPYTYLWSTGDTTQTVTGLTPGQYHITVTDAVGCLEVQACVVVTPLCCLWAQWESTPDGCQGLGSGTATIIEIGGGVPPYIVTLPNGTTKVSNGTMPIVINGLTAGNHILNITDSKGCTLEQWLEVGQISGPTATISLATINCGQTNTTATVNVTNGNMPYTYLWGNGTTTASATLSAGTHTVTVTDKNGCTTTATAVVTLPQPPVVTLATTNTTCGEENGSITATITGGMAPYTCLWSNGATTDNLTNVAPGAYTLTVTGANGCTAVNFATVLPSIGVQDTMICVMGCDSVFAYGMVFHQTTTTSFTENVNGCNREVNIHAVVLQTGGTITQNITACYGTTVTVNGISYTNDATVTTTGTGACPGQVIWNVEFSAKPDTISAPLTQVCGFQDTTFTFPVSYTGVNGCTNLVVLKAVQVNKVEQEIAWLNQIEQCGLLAKTDTLYKGVQFNSATCTLTTTLQKLVTNPIQQEIVWGTNDTICSTVASTREILDGITVVSDSCTQDVNKHLLVTVPFTTDTILGPAQQMCSTENGTFFAYDGESVNDCKRTLTIHPVETTEWQTVSVYGPEVHFCGDTSITLINFDGRKIGANCTDTTFLHKVVVGLSTQDTTWNAPMVKCGFPTGTFVVSDSSKTVGCHTQVFAKKVTINPIFSHDVIGVTVTHCGISTDSVLVTDNTFTDTVNCIQNVYKHWEVTIPLSDQGLWNDTVSVCGINYNAELIQDSVVIDNANCLKKTYRHWKITYPIATSSKQASFCHNDSYTWARNGKVYTEPGVYTDTTFTAEGCPDIATLYLTELPLAYGDTTVFVCPGQFYEYEGNMFGAGEEEFHYVSNNGCDSTFVLKVKEVQNPMGIQIPSDVTLNLPLIGQDTIDQIVSNLATGDTVNILGGTVIQTLVKVSDTLWIQSWVIQTPCDSLQRSRMITVTQPLPPVNPPSDTCHVWFKTNPVAQGTAPVVVIEGVSGDVSLELQTGNGAIVWSNKVGPLSFQHTEVNIFADLKPGLYWLVVEVPELKKKDQRFAKPLVVVQ